LPFIFIFIEPLSFLDAFFWLSFLTFFHTSSFVYLPFLFLLRADIALALDRASALDDAPQARNDNSSLVGLPFASRSGPGALPMRARNDARRGLSPAFTGAFKVPPLYEARPMAFNPPAGFLPSLRCHAGDFI
jgi:hypothetical protein